MTQKFAATNRRPRRTQPLLAPARARDGDDEPIGAERCRGHGDETSRNAQTLRDFGRSPRPVLGEHEGENRGLNGPPWLVRE